MGRLLPSQSYSTKLGDLKMNVKRAAPATLLAELFRDKLIVRGPERVFDWLLPGLSRMLPTRLSSCSL